MIENERHRVPLDPSWCAAIHSDAAELRYRTGSFDSAATCTMLHHVPTRWQQHAVISELVRVVRRGGVLIGSDRLASNELRAFHHGDTYNPLPPGTLLSWLQQLGCRRITVTVDDVMTFVATKGRKRR